MADPSSYRPASGEIPTDPGVYRFFDDQGRVIYVGKAKNLRNRLNSYFRDVASLQPRTQRMVTTAVGVKWVVVGSEVEALTLEYTWIKEFQPRFNIMFRDDKSYPYLAVTVGEKIPRVYVTREQHRPGVRYFGPYAHTWAIRNSLEELLNAFPVRTCSRGVLNRAQAQGRPCLLGDIDRCAAPCVGRVSAAEHRDMVNQLCRFMEGHTGEIIANLQAEMEAEARALNYEQAALARNAIAALRQILERNAVVLDDATDADIFALAGDELEAAVQVFHVRAGRIRGERGWVVERVSDASEPELISALLEQVYADAQSARRDRRQAATSSDDIEHEAPTVIPPQVWVPQLPPNREVLEQWLSAARGTKVRIKVPQRGPKAELAKRVHANAEQALRLHKSRRVGDLTQRSAALEELQENLGLERAPLRIECFDVSHTQGTHRVASMVVFEDGAPRKSHYRRFNVQGVDTDRTDDTAAMAEILTRRLRHLDAGDEIDAGDELDAAASAPTQTAGPRRFAYRPDLIVVDGGLPQVNAAARVIAAAGADIAVIGLAKRLEEVWLPDSPFPIILPRRSPALYLLQFLRDESHRFAITHHRKKRGAALLSSALDAIPGLGPARQRDLLRHFKSVARMRQATVAQLQEVAGVGPALAATIHSHLNGGTTTPKE